jgi:hypothetical protein
MMDGDSIDERGWSAGRTAGLVGRVLVCLVLLAVIAGAIYATVLPALTWHKLHQEKAGVAAER